MWYHFMENRKIILLFKNLCSMHCYQRQGAVLWTMHTKVLPICLTSAEANYLWILTSHHKALALWVAFPFTYCSFGTAKRGKKEFGGREIGERERSSPVWYHREIDERKRKFDLIREAHIKFDLPKFGEKVGGERGSFLSFPSISLVPCNLCSTNGGIIVYLGKTTFVLSIFYSTKQEERELHFSFSFTFFHISLVPTILKLNITSGRDKDTVKTLSKLCWRT